MKKTIKGYSAETLKRLMKAFKECIAKYENQAAADIKICISKGNRKIGRAMNVSLPPVISCSNCSECKHFCYDIRSCIQYANTVIDARVRNWMILNKDRDLYFSRIDDACSRRKSNKMFRWHVAGDIVDIDYFERMVKIAVNHPDFVFWTYTKNYSVVNEYCRKYGKASIPGNFSVMFSEWKGMPIDNPYNFGEFRCLYLDEEIPADTYYCPGNCDICKASGRGCIVNENTCIYLH